MPVLTMLTSMTTSLPLKVSFSHMGLFAHDAQALAAFYCRVLGFQITDRAGVTELGQTPQDLIFLSVSPDEHHQIVIAPGRAANIPTTINQIALEVESLVALLEAKTILEANHIADIIAMNHGGTWSLYFSDPEGNQIELFARSDVYVPSTATRPLDCTQSADAIVATTHSMANETPGSMTWEDWKLNFLKGKFKP